METPAALAEKGLAPATSAYSRNITVFCRLKPHFFPPKRDALIVEDKRTIRVNQPVLSSPQPDFGHRTIATRSSLVFTYDRVYEGSSSQKVIFEEVGKPLVKAVCTGVNATVLAYGTTASGKTYTILGGRAATTSEVQGVGNGDQWNDRPGEHRQGHENAVGKLPPEADKCCDTKTSDGSHGSTSGGETNKDGLLPRMIFYLFHCLNREPHMTAGRLVKAAAIEIYNERIVDLATGRTGLKVHTPKSGQVSIVGLHEELVNGPDAAIAYLDSVTNRRKTAATNLNADSSRSHFVFWLILQEKSSLTGSSVTARLSIVDLAGSERLLKTRTCGGTQVEGAMINKSLTCLGKVIKCLASLNDLNKERSLGVQGDDGKTSCSTQQGTCFIPYRDSKLTRVLQDSLGGNSYTSIVLTCSQDGTHLAESIATLRFGQRARNVKNTLREDVAGDCEKSQPQKGIWRYRDYIRDLALWGETAIVKLSDISHSVTEGVCVQQRSPARCKQKASSKRVGLKRVNTSACPPVKGCDNGEGQAEVVEKLLSGFPAPPKALQLDFTKDDVAMKIRHRLHWEAASATRQEERWAYACGAVVPTSTQSHNREASDDHQAKCLLAAGRIAGRDSPVKEPFAPVDVQDRHGYVATPFAEQRRSTHSLDVSTKVLPTSSTIDDSGECPENTDDRRSSSSPSSKSQGVTHAGATSSFRTGKPSKQQRNVNDARAELIPCQRQDAKNWSDLFESADDRQPSSSAFCEHKGVNAADATSSSHAQETSAQQHNVDNTRRAELTPCESSKDQNSTARCHLLLPAYSLEHGQTRAASGFASSMVRLALRGTVTVAQHALCVRPNTFWQVAKSWIPNVQSLFLSRARKLEELRRATQLDDAIRLRQRLLVGD